MNSITAFFYRVAQDFWEQHTPEEQWRRLLTAEDPNLSRFRPLFKNLPSASRCKFCNAPFHGVDAPVMRLMGRSPSQLNPRFYRICLDTVPVGGTELELSILFADVRRSTSMAERQGASEFSRLIHRFFNVSTRVSSRPML